MDSTTAEPSAVVPPPLIPPPAVRESIAQMDAPTALDEDTNFPVPVFAKAILDRRKQRVPQCIAHRGFKAKFPENTLLAFEKAVSAGAQGLETDIHLTKDDVVVLSHDANLKRCFGRTEKVVQSTWDEIKDLRTLAAPHLPMPRLKELLEYLSKPGLEDIWLLLDIKLDNNAEDVMRLIGSTVKELDLNRSKPWKDRIALGIWAAKYLPLAAKYLPGFPVIHIGLKSSYARHFFETPNVGFNMLVPMMIGPGGKGFMQACQNEHDRQLLGWTVNDRDKMQWCIRRRFDGVITDDPSLFLNVCEEHDELSKEPVFPLGFRAFVETVRVYVLITVLLLVSRKRLRPDANSNPIKKARARVGDR